MDKRGTTRITPEIARAEGWYSPNTNGGKCHCDCGVVTPIARDSSREKRWIAGEHIRFIRGHQLRTEAVRARTRETQPRGPEHHMWKGGHANKHPLWGTWAAMIARCENPNNSRYEDWGGRGITVCKRWREDFRNFLADMGERPDGLSIDRIDNDGNYEPGNVRWATASQQRRNRRDYIAAHGSQVAGEKVGGLR